MTVLLGGTESCVATVLNQIPDRSQFWFVVGLDSKRASVAASRWLKTPGFTSGPTFTWRREHSALCDFLFVTIFYS